MPQRYPDTSQPSYTSVIDDKSYKRLRNTLEDARHKGAEVVPLVPSAAFNDELRKIPPHMVLNVTDDMSELTLEIVLLSIFGTDLERLEKDFGSNPFDIVTKETARDLKFAFKFRQLAKLVGGRPIKTVKHYLDLLRLIWDTEWHRAERPTDPADAAIWDRRAALLDAALYQVVQH